MTTNPSITSYLQNWFGVQFIKEVKRRKKQVLYMILIDANTPIDTIPTCCPITAVFNIHENDSMIKKIKNFSLFEND